MLVLATAWYGTLPAWLTLLGIIALGLALRGGAIGPAVGYLREANSALSTEVVQLKAARAELVAEVARLKARTDLEPLQAALVHSIDRHSTETTREHAAMLHVLEMIAERLGPDPANGA